MAETSVNMGPAIFSFGKNFILRIDDFSLFLLSYCIKFLDAAYDVNK